MIILCGIYKITSPSKKVYIGKSKNIIKTWRDRYQKDKDKLKCKMQPKIYNSLKKYGWQKHNFEILSICNESELYVLESYYEELYDSTNRKTGLNSRKCGIGPGRVLDDQKKEISRKLKGTKRSASSIEKQRKTIAEKGGVWNKGKTGIFTEEALKKIGNRHSDESYKKAAEKLKGAKQTEEHKKKNSEGLKKHWIKRKASGWKMPEESIKKISNSLKNKK